MNDEHVEAILAAAPTGVACDGFRIEADGDLFTVHIANETIDQLDAAALKSVATEYPEYVSNWYYWSCLVGESTTGRVAFLRWLERGDTIGVPERYELLRDGIQREWGEILITTDIERDGVRRYTLRHQQDRDADPDQLSSHDDPLAARDIATFDERGRYRPLKTAPTLSTGWQLSALDATEVIEAVDFVYPATIANWAREQAGQLDIQHWQSTADRQTGIYESVADLDAEAVEWAAQACCTDGACLKRRRWEYDADRELEVPPGTGEFPCREPCSFLIAAAKEWAARETETERTYEFELTPSEYAQLTDIVHAVANDRIDDIDAAAFADPANRRRVRYLAAKRFAGDDPPGTRDAD